jgi:hypothetical protein
VERECVRSIEFDQSGPGDVLRKPSAAADAVVEGVTSVDHQCRNIDLLRFLANVDLDLEVEPCPHHGRRHRGPLGLREPTLESRIIGNGRRRRLEDRAIDAIRIQEDLPECSGNGAPVLTR